MTVQGWKPCKFIKFAIKSSISDSRGVVLFKAVLGSWPAAPVVYLDGINRVESAQNFVDGLY